MENKKYLNNSVLWSYALFKNKLNFDLTYDGIMYS